MAKNDEKWPKMVKNRHFLGFFELFLMKKLICGQKPTFISYYYTIKKLNNIYNIKKKMGIWPKSIFIRK